MSVFRLFCIFVLTATCAACGPEPRRTVEDFDSGAAVLALDEADPVVARVEGTMIRRSDVEREALAQQGDSTAVPPAMGSEKFDRVLEELIDQRLLALEARRRDLHQSEEARRRLALAEERILGNVLVETALADAVTDETIQRIYEEQIRLIPLGEEVRARHILVQTRDEAVAIKALLDEGRDFAELAVAMSEDQATRLEGGDLGYFSREGILPAFGAVAFATPEGVVSEPFQSEFGWHILTVVDRRRQPPPSLEALRPNIIRFYTFDQLEALIEGLRSEAEIERADLSLALAPPDEAGEEGVVSPEPEESLNSDEPG
ncbi:peptidyl-prolyl cis-trans isomerase C [Maricaulis maris]|uniref:Parvulin-like PPIase n=1 Tax=Maricaulis maris TaxID=74318 RepID=A0A495DDT7_9PROT|nr:peptidyl-prolyl cis-trans isomerase C [Maricaulis maris]